MHNTLPTFLRWWSKHFTNPSWQMMVWWWCLDGFKTAWEINNSPSIWWMYMFQCRHPADCSWTLFLFLGYNGIIMLLQYQGGYGNSLAFQQQSDLKANCGCTNEECNVKYSAVHAWNTIYGACPEHINSLSNAWQFLQNSKFARM